MELDVEKIISGIVVELVKLSIEEIRKKITNRKNPKKSKKRSTRKKNV